MNVRPFVYPDAGAPPLEMFVYARGQQPRQTLGLLWQMVEAEAAAPKLFHAQRCAHPSMRGDLTEFVRYFDEPGRSLLIMADPESDELAGMVWFDDYVPTHRAAINLFYRRRFWGARSREATRRAVTWAFETFHVESIWGYTPWESAARHGEAIGFTRVATLPGFAFIDEKPADTILLRVMREEWTP